MLKVKNLFNPCNFIAQFLSASQCNTFLLVNFRTFIADYKIIIPVKLKNFIPRFNKI